MNGVGFGMAHIKTEGTPVHPYEFDFKRKKDFNKQLLAFFDYWISKGNDMSRDFAYKEYLEVKGKL
jgi:hypothetical protein